MAQFDDGPGDDTYPANLSGISDSMPISKTAQITRNFGSSGKVVLRGVEYTVPKISNSPGS